MTKTLSFPDLGTVATVRKLTRVFSQENFDKYVSQQVRSMTRARDKGHRDFKNMTDAEIEKGAQFLARANNAGEKFL